MVSIIENRSFVRGVVKALHKNKGPAGHDQLEVDLHTASDVEDFPNLAKADEEKTILINVKPGLMDTVKMRSGQSFEGLVSKAFGQVYFLHPSKKE